MGYSRNNQNMRLTTRDLYAFAYCPYLYWNRGTEKIVPPLNLFENNVRLSILAAEKRAMDKGSHVNPRKIGYFWERYWWSAAGKLNMTPREIDKACYPATLKFIDYCKYDISSELYDIVGVCVPSEVKLRRGILATEIDIIKLNRKTNNLTLIDFTRKNMSRVKMISDIEVLSKIYAFSSLGVDISYFCIDLSKSLQKVKISACFFDTEDSKNLGKIVNHLSDGIHRNVNYKCYWQCERCDKCSK